MRNDYIQYLSDLHIKEVDDLLQRFMRGELSRQEFDVQIIEWAVTETSFIKNEKIENLFFLRTK